MPRKRKLPPWAIYEELGKTVTWYDNEYGFVTQLIRTLEKFAKL